MALLDRKKLLTKEDFKVEKVDLGDGDFVYVRQMSGREIGLNNHSSLKNLDRKRDLKKPSMTSGQNLQL